MIGEEMLGKKPVTLAKMKEILSAKKKDKELNYEQDIALKYAKKFSKTTPKETEKIKEDLSKIESLNDELRVKIIDLLPTKKEMLELMISKEAAVPEEDLAKILEITNKYRKK